MPTKRFAFICLVSLLLTGVPLATAGAREITDPARPSPAPPGLPDRSVEPIVMSGSQFPSWSAGAEISAKEPTVPPTSSCEHDTANGPSDLGFTEGYVVHNCSEAPLISNAQNPDAQQPRVKLPNPREGADVDKLAGYRWTGSSFEQRPFQVDERFYRYISNFASNCGNGDSGFCVGFGAYAGADKQLSYVYDRDVYKINSSASDPCFADPNAGTPEQDPIKGLDDNDELTFLFRDAGDRQAPPTARPAGIADLKEVRIDDPANPGKPLYFYIGYGDVAHEFDADNGYMRYQREADSWKWEQTSTNYGNAPRGPVCKNGATSPNSNGPRRPQDNAWILTPRYAFHYAGRWSLQGVRVSDQSGDDPLDSPDQYSAPLIDGWKARAYAQGEHDHAAIGGHEDEEGWNSTSITTGEKAGPVRVIRTTQGSDSGTNTVRTEIFYPDVIQQFTYLRVHPLPPLGGILAYWDHHSGPNEWYFNSEHGGRDIPVDGVNDEVVGNGYLGLGRPGLEVREDDDSFGGAPGTIIPGDPCAVQCQTEDVPDPTVNMTGTLSWEEFGSGRGSMVFRTGLNINKDQVSPGDAQGLLSFPYYRDDANLDDGTGTRTRIARTDDANTPPLEDYGLYGAHGVQVFTTPESDNGAFVGTVPLTEVDAQTRIVVLPPQLDADHNVVSVGSRYTNDVPLQATTDASPQLDKTRIDITSPTQAKIGDQVQLAATLTDEHSLPVPNAALSFDFDGHLHSATTDMQGHAVVSDPVYAMGPARTTNLDVTYLGDALHSPARKSTNFTITRRPSTIAFTAASGTTGQVNHTMTLEALVADPAPVAGAPVRFSFQGINYDAVTDDNGVATTLPLTVNGPAGAKTARATFEGDDDHDGSSAETTVDVTKDTTSLTFTDASATSGTIGSTAHLVAKLSDTAGALSGATVRFVFQGATYDVETDGNGIATKDVPVAGPSGTTTVAASFSGDDSHEHSSGDSPFTVTKGASAISFTAKSRSGYVTVNVNLRDAVSRSGLSGRTVTVYVSGSKRATVVTGQTGAAAVRFKYGTPEGKTFRVTFAGDDSYAGSSAQGKFGRNGASGSS